MAVMNALTLTSALARADEIKDLLLAAEPFHHELERLYLDLRQQGRHDWVLRVYHHLSLYVPPKRKSDVCHPAVLQAFLTQGNLKQARRTAQILLDKNPKDPETRKLLRALEIREKNTLPPYTPLAALSKYATRTPIRSAKTDAVPPLWLAAIGGLTPQKLRDIGYFTARKQLSRAPRAFRTELLDMFDELALNYLFQNRRAIVALAGALIELMLGLYASSHLKIKKVSLPNGQLRSIFDMNLNDLINYYTQKGLLPGAMLRLSRAARTQRNFIHPGKEVLENVRITPAGARLCFLAVLELSDALFSAPPDKV